MTLIHADDFYKPDSQIPVNKDGVQDWDCAGALDIVKFRETLLKVKEGGEVPEVCNPSGLISPDLARMYVKSADEGIAMGVNRIYGHTVLDMQPIPIP